MTLVILDPFASHRFAASEPTDVPWLALRVLSAFLSPPTSGREQDPPGTHQADDGNVLLNAKSSSGLNSPLQQTLVQVAMRERCSVCLALHVNAMLPVPPSPVAFRKHVLAGERVLHYPADPNYAPGFCSWLRKIVRACFKMS